MQVRENPPVVERSKSSSRTVITFIIIIIIEPAVHAGFVVLVPEVLEGRRQRNGEIHLLPEAASDSSPAAAAAGSDPLPGGFAANSSPAAADPLPEAASDSLPAAAAAGSDPLPGGFAGAADAIWAEDDGSSGIGLFEGACGS